jgi:hypothetical protein
MDNDKASMNYALNDDKIIYKGRCFSLKLGTFFKQIVRFYVFFHIIDFLQAI